MASFPALQSFIDTGLINAVAAQLKSGKEATAYCCLANPSCGYELLLAKVYADPQQRSFHNDAAYRDGIYINDARLRRATRKHSRVGREVDFGMWLRNEYDTLRTLYAAGADVPKPLAMGENAILMEYIGDENNAAPQLNKITLTEGEAQVLYLQLLGNIRLWLANHRVHADLSPFNILYWQGTIKVIDFPQAVDARLNSQAYMFLHRDIENVCRHFQKYGVSGEAWRIADDMWNRYISGRL